MVDLSVGGYATTADLAAWLVDVTLPDDAVRLLRSASLRVALACQRDPYIDTPATTEVAPLRDATCAQAAVWVTLGVSPDAVGSTSGVVKRSTILSATVERDTSVSAATLDEAINTLAPEAAAILTAAGLIWLPVPTQATDAGFLPSWGIDSRLFGLGWDAPAASVDLDAWPFG